MKRSKRKIFKKLIEIIRGQLYNKINGLNSTKPSTEVCGALLKEPVTHYSFFNDSLYHRWIAL